MRILVTGSSGFIGSHVVEAAVAAGHDVHGLDLRPARSGGPRSTGAAGGPGADAGPGAPGWVASHGDVGDPDTCDAALAGVDAVVHLAAKVGLGVDVQDLPGYVSTNDLGTAVLLAAMARASVRRLVLGSSMVVYGEGAYSCPAHGAVAPGPRDVADLEGGQFEPACPRCSAELTTGLVVEDARLDPRNTYAATKVAQEHLASSWARATGARVHALRFHNVYGPRMPLDTPYAGVAAVFRSALAAGRAPSVFEDGGQRRDFVHVSDVAAACVSALGADLPAGTSRAFNVGSGEPHTVGQLASAMAAAADPTGRLAAVVSGQFRLGDVRHVTASSRRLRDELGWLPTVSFADGVAAFVREWAAEGVPV